jgi:hypothetical protein
MMRRFGLIAAALGFVFAVCVGISPLRAEVYPGAFHVGDSNGDGLIDSGDYSTLKLEVAGIGGVYTNTQPPTRLIQDLDGDGLIQSADASILKLWS